MTDYWYENSHLLDPEQIYTHEWDDCIVKLDRRVPGDGTRWYAATWHGRWIYDDYTVEPGDLARRLPDNWEGEPSNA